MHFPIIFPFSSSPSLPLSLFLSLSPFYLFSLPHPFPSPPYATISSSPLFSLPHRSSSLPPSLPTSNFITRSLTPPGSGTHQTTTNDDLDHRQHEKKKRVRVNIFVTLPLSLLTTPWSVPTSLPPLVYTPFNTTPSFTFSSFPYAPPETCCPSTSNPPPSFSFLFCLTSNNHITSHISRLSSSFFPQLLSSPLPSFLLFFHSSLLSPRRFDKRKREA
ncbi:hypothetical protein K457DRAFT_498754 [Linnemannia elongata AG-77]|uniref:Uncharacterized protein n=1 Tax=Linnemannia elongata AG-77 TaxID=1314771 RepID=A0A197KH04_9FUNG|nr:hypothetical protein K457DRAFT_498754 [Linnemannia elongata AG-77]